jgi:hypothetical protein
MPLKSKKQRGFLHAKYPALADKFEAETPKGTKLPTYAKKKKKPKSGY